MRLEIRFDYLCFFVPYKEDIVAVLPDLRKDPIHDLQVGIHHPVFRWIEDQQGSQFPSAADGRSFHPRTILAQTSQFPKLRVSELDGEEIQILINGEPLVGSRPPIHHLLGLTRLAEGDFEDAAFEHLHSGFLATPPKPRAEVPKEEVVNIAARIFLRGGTFEIESGGLSHHDFFLSEEADPDKAISPAKRIARQVLWRSDEISPEADIHALFLPFDPVKPRSFVHLRPANLSDKTISLSIRNCDEIQDYLLPGLPSYSAIDNFEPRVYQTLSAGYTGFASVKRLLHRPIVQSGNSVCGPGQGSGAQP